MDKTIFYAPNIIADLELPHDEAIHCAKVLRKQEGDEILITDGQGHFYNAVLTMATQKHCLVNIVSEVPFIKNWNFSLQIAFAPTKNIERIEWFAEKATEIGIDEFSPLLCRYSERKDIKTARLEKILVSAMKQSQKACLPVLNELESFTSFVKKPFDGEKYIAHCYEGEKNLLKDIYSKGENALILIGPEGDFSEQEVEDALANGFKPISLGESRLRTETAALVACHTIHVLNQ